MSRVYNFFSGTGGSARRSTEGSGSRDAGLQGNRNVCYGDESSFQSFRGNYHRS